MDSPAQEVIASRVVIPGPDGQPRIELGLVEGEPVMRFFDASGKERIRLGFDRDDDDDHGGLVAELHITAADDGGEVRLTAAYGGNASISLGGEMCKAERTAAGAWIEANEGRLEASILSRSFGAALALEDGSLEVKAPCGGSGGKLRIGALGKRPEILE